MQGGACHGPAWQTSQSSLGMATGQAQLNLRHSTELLPQPTDEEENSAQCGSKNIYTITV